MTVADEQGGTKPPKSQIEIELNRNRIEDRVRLFLRVKKSFISESRDLLIYLISFNKTFHFWSYISSLRALGSPSPNCSLNRLKQKIVPSKKRTLHRAAIADLVVLIHFLNGLLSPERQILD